MSSRLERFLLLGKAFCHDGDIQLRQGINWSWNPKERCIFYDPKSVEVDSEEECSSLLIHEAGHCLITRLHLLTGDIFRNRSLFFIFNALEDVRVDTFQGMRYPNYQEWNYINLFRKVFDILTGNFSENHKLLILIASSSFIDPMQLVKYLDAKTMDLFYNFWPKFREILAYSLPEADLRLPLDFTVDPDFALVLKNLDTVVQDPNQIYLIQLQWVYLDAISLLKEYLKKYDMFSEFDSELQLLRPADYALVFPGEKDGDNSSKDYVTWEKVEKLRSKNASEDNAQNNTKDDADASTNPLKTVGGEDSVVSEDKKNNSKPEGNNGSPKGDNGIPEGNSGNPKGDSGIPEGNNGNPKGNNGNPKGDRGKPKRDRSSEKRYRENLSDPYAYYYNMTFEKDVVVFAPLPGYVPEGEDNRKFLNFYPADLSPKMSMQPLSTSQAPVMSVVVPVVDDTHDTKDEGMETYLSKSLSKPERRIDTRKLKFNTWDHYRDIVADGIAQTIQFFRRFFEITQRFTWQSGYAYGQKLDLRRCMQAQADERQKMHLWMRKKSPAPATFAASILVDLSGSMNNRTDKTNCAVVLLCEVLKHYRIPFRVDGFKEKFYRLLEFGDFLDDTKKRQIIDRIDSSDGYNDDGAALLEEAQMLLLRPEEIKLMFVISDGLPTNSANPEKDLHDAVKKIKDKLYLIGLGVGPGTESMKLYYPYCRHSLELQDVASAIASLIDDILHYRINEMIRHREL